MPISEVYNMNTQFERSAKPTSLLLEKKMQKC